MSNDDQIKALAELDGWEARSYFCAGYESTYYHKDRACHSLNSFEYLTSYNAIIPLIQKQELGTRLRFYGNCLVLTRAYGLTDSPLELKPSQLCEALLKSVGKWKE